MIFVGGGLGSPGVGIFLKGPYLGIEELEETLREGEKVWYMILDCHL